MAENNLIENGRLVYCKGHWIGARSGLMTGIAAGGSVFGLRNVTNEELILSKLVMSWLTTTPFTAAQGLAFAAYKATAFTVIQTGGITPNPTRKRVADHTALLPAEVEAVIADATALTGSAFTVDADDPLSVLSTSLAVASATGINFGQDVWTPGNQVPLSLGPDEGVVVLVQNAMLAAGVGRLYVGADVHKA
jgi:hypothetical protein